MHRSRLFGILIDAPAADADAAATFWAAALGGSSRRSTEEPEYTRIDAGPPDLALVVQSVDDAPRYHLDIETDDVAAESARLLALGAELVTDHGGHRILRAPGGHLICVVPVQSAETLFAADSQAWPSA
ncbi:VOC family protein [Actinoplanes regularis]|uniref:VOC family protein n=1 Tax=Actinoplanes regularis TaxID=52697 RepID=UPI002553A2C2|nr:VOC family protein [Actinoplanes regularis]